MSHMLKAQSVILGQAISTGSNAVQLDSNCIAHIQCGITHLTQPNSTKLFQVQSILRIKAIGCRRKEKKKSQIRLG